MNGAVAQMWHAADEDEKLAMLHRVKQGNYPLTTNLLGEDKAEMDRLAKLVGLVPVYVPTVDACGLSCSTPGVVSPSFADRYRARSNPL